jgi:hypothetical protein
VVAFVNSNAHKRVKYRKRRILVWYLSLLAESGASLTPRAASLLPKVAYLPCSPIFASSMPMADTKAAGSLLGVIKTSLRSLPP